MLHLKKKNPFSLIQTKYSKRLFKLEPESTSFDEAGFNALGFSFVLFTQDCYLPTPEETQKEGQSMIWFR